MKGAALAGEIYEDIGLRPMGDLDLLVHRKDVSEAYILLERLGFQKSTVELWSGTDQDFWHEALLTNDEGRVVEVHWNLPQVLMEVFMFQFVSFKLDSDWSR